MTGVTSILLPVLRRLVLKAKVILDVKSVGALKMVDIPPSGRRDGVVGGIQREVIIKVWRVDGIIDLMGEKVVEIWRRGSLIPLAVNVSLIWGPTYYT